MKVYIADSLPRSEDSTISAFAFKFQNQNFRTNLSLFKYEGEPGFSTRSDIKSSHLFVGIIAQGGDKSDFVYKEWLYALKVHIPGVLLIEDELFTLNSKMKNHPNILVFNRSNPDPTIAQINQNIKDAALQQEGQLNDALAWMIGGKAVISLVNLLSKQKQEAA